MPPHKPPTVPQSSDYDPDEEPQPYLGGFDPWRELQPEHDVARERQLELYQHEKEEVAQLVASVFRSGRGPELLELMKVMVKALPRHSYETIIHRDAKQDLLDWIDQEIKRAMNI